MRASRLESVKTKDMCADVCLYLHYGVVCHG